MEFSGFTHPYNKIGSTILYPQSCFYQLPMKFRPENTILHSLCMDILSQFHDSGLFLVVIEYILTALLSQAIQVVDVAGFATITTFPRCPHNFHQPQPNIEGYQVRAFSANFQGSAFQMPSSPSDRFARIWHFRLSL